MTILFSLLFFYKFVSYNPYHVFFSVFQKQRHQYVATRPTRTSAMQVRPAGVGQIRASIQTFKNFFKFFKIKF